jgi:hypothetical protein
MNKEDQEFRSLMDTLNFMMNDRQLPLPIRLRLRSFLLSNRVTKNYEAHRKILDSLSAGLRSEILWELNRIWLHKVPFLNELATMAKDPKKTRAVLNDLIRFLRGVTEHMNMCVYAQAELFGEAHVLYILKRGIVSRVGAQSIFGGSAGKLLRSGQAWGDDFMITSPLLKERPLKFALTYVETVQLDHGCILALLANCDRSGPDLRQSLRRHAIKLAVRRAAIKLGKRAIQAKQMKQIQMTQMNRSVEEWSSFGSGDLNEPPLNISV